MKVLVATEKPFAKEAVDKIAAVCQEAGYEMVLLEKYPSKDDLLLAVKDADAMIVRSDIVDADVLAAGKQLKLVVRAGAGYDTIDIAAAKERNVVVENTPGQNANAVAELVLGMMVYMARGKFNGKSGFELKGKKLGLHAYGNVSRCVAHIAHGFGMEVIACDPYIDDDVMKADGVTPVKEYKTLYETCDYVSLHLPLMDATRHMVNYQLLKTMKKGAALVNSARAEVVCEDGLKTMLTERGDFRYISDVAPGNAGELEEHFPNNVYFTPKKMGAQTEEANINAGVAAARQIVAFFEKNDATFRVN